MRVPRLLFPLGCFLTIAGITAGAGEEIAFGEFRKKQEAIAGSFAIVSEAGRLVLEFGENFKAKSGPDLQVILSPLPFEKVNRKNANGKGSLNLGLLKSAKGAQSFDIPAGTDLSQFQSILVHCVRYRHLWGGAPLILKSSKGGP